MAQTALDKCQLAGLDPHERGFSRPVEFEPTGTGYRAVLRYEALRITADPCPAQDEALRHLIHLLHGEGYRQLRTQMSFRGGLYLGSQEPWVEHPDPQPEPQADGLFARLAGWLRPRPAREQLR
jgi:hypothetical protein